MSTNQSQLSPARVAQGNVYEVFPADTLRQIAHKHKTCLKDLATIETDMKRRFVELDDAIWGIILSVASGEPLLFVGPPGTAKSWLVRSFCEYVGIDLGSEPGENKPADSDGAQSKEAVSVNAKPEPERDYFEYLLTSFTEPSELFGYFELRTEVDENDKEQQVLRRNDVGMMQFARIVFLDEVFKGSSAILNSLLSFINERIFHDRGQRKKVRMECLFGATNETPRAHEFQLRAIFDRFTLRCQVDNVKAEPINVFNLLAKGWPETYRLKGKAAEATRCTEGIEEGEEWPCVDVPEEMELVFPDLIEQLDNLRKDIACMLPDEAELIQGLGRRVNGKSNGKTGTTGSSPRSSAVLPNGADGPTFVGDLAVLIQHIRDNNLSQMSNRRVIKFVYILLIHSLYDAVRKAGDGDIESIYFSRKDMVELLVTFSLDRRDEQGEQQLRDLL